MNTFNLIEDGYLRVTEKQLHSLVEKFGEDGAVDYLNEYVDYHQVLFPVCRPTLEEADADHTELCNLNARTLLKVSDHQVGCKYPSENFPLSNRYVGMSNIGRAASNYFHYHSRTFCEHDRSPSPARVWNTPSSRRGVFKAIFSLKKKQIDNRTLQSCIEMRRYWAAQHRPTTTKALIDKYARNGCVLDPCSGWGDRLQGFMASSGVEYVGADPNLRLHHGYRSQILRYKQDSQDARVVYSPFEKMTVEENHFDLAFTSPPYFSTEKYSQDKGQSYLNYTECDQWISKFLIPLVERSYAALKPNGVLAVNIADVYVKGEVHSICDPMNVYLRDKLHAKEMKHVGYQIARRANMGVPVGGVCAEPIFMWRKPKARKL